LRRPSNAVDAAEAERGHRDQVHACRHGSERIGVDGHVLGVAAVAFGAHAAEPLHHRDHRLARRPLR
jgi:hypothetical protein